MKTTTITIPDDLDAELDELARDRNVTTDKVVETALRQYLVDAQR
jgi:predicted transcriptional regulator